MILFFTVTASAYQIVHQEFFQDFTSINQWKYLENGYPSPQVQLCGDQLKNRFIGTYPTKTQQLKRKKITVKPFFKAKMTFQFLKVDTAQSQDTLLIFLNNFIVFSWDFPLCRGLASICGNSVKDFQISDNSNYVQNQHIRNVQTHELRQSSNQITIIIKVDVNNPDRQSFFLRRIRIWTQQCHWSCKTCSGPNPDNCKTCYSNVTFINSRCLCPSPERITIQGPCTPTCPAGTKQSVEAGVNMCSACPSKSIECQSILICVSAFYKKGSECVACPINCKTCSSLIFCLSCKDTYDLGINMLGQTLCIPCISYDQTLSSGCKDCAKGYFADQGTCYSCRSACQTCTSNLVCQSCNQPFFLYNQQCELTCPSSLNKVNSSRKCEQMCPPGTAAHSGICMSCHKSCQNCFFPGSSQKCTSCFEGNYLYRFTCMIQCPQGYSAQNITSRCLPTARSKRRSCKTGCNYGKYYSVQDQICLACPSNCIQCTNSFHCTFCSHNYGLSPQRQCLSCGFCLQCDIQKGGCLSCIEGFSLYDRQCNKCMPNCLKCLFYDTCIIQNDFFCKQVSLGCRPCSFNCEKCESESLACLKCKPLSVLKEKVCIEISSNCLQANSQVCLTCKPRYYIQAYQCLSCQNRCSHCNKLVCFSCTQNFVLKGNQCLPCADTCQLCKGQFVYINKACELQCASRWDSIKRQCSCSPSCQKCSIKGMCQSCKSGYEMGKQAINCTKIELYKVQNITALIQSEKIKTLTQSASFSTNIMVTLGLSSLAFSILVDNYLLKIHHFVNMPKGDLTRLGFSLLNSPQPSLLLENVQQKYKQAVQRLDTGRYEFKRNKFIEKFFEQQFSFLNKIFQQIQDLLFFFFYLLLLVLILSFLKIVGSSSPLLSQRLVHSCEVLLILIFQLEAPLSTNIWMGLLRRPYSWNPIFLIQFMVCVIVMSGMIVLNIYVCVMLMNLKANSDQKFKIDKYTEQLLLSFKFRRSIYFQLILQYFRPIAITTVLMAVCNPFTQLALLITYNSSLFFAYYSHRRQINFSYLVLTRSAGFILFEVLLVIYGVWSKQWLDWMCVIVMGVVELTCIFQLVLESYEVLRQVIKRARNSLNYQNPNLKQICVIVSKKTASSQD